MKESDQQRAIIKSQEKAMVKKATEHLLGICQGITADGALHDREVHFLQTWLSQFREVTTQWPGKTLARRVDEILRDGVITDTEREDLMSALNTMCRNDFLETGAADTGIIDLPFDDDPHIIFRDRTFCYTGQFLFGTRSKCERAAEKLGAISKDSVSKSLDYLVVGSIPEPTWTHSNYGTKIMTAMKYIDDDCGIALVSEHQWTLALTGVAA
jgi:NAD-dependent DNA ligase